MATVSATADAAPGSPNGAHAAFSGSVVTLAATGSSDAGDFRASTMSKTGSWSVSPGSGDFTYSVPIEMPPPAEGSAPDMSLGYDSQSVDGLTSSTNNQSSGAGLGWDVPTDYVERSYKNCQQDGQGTIEEDMCWFSPYTGTASGHVGDAVYTISLDGHASQLVPDATTPNEFHLTNDPGWYVIKHGSPNTSATATTTTETFQVFAPDGTVYDLGYGVDKKTGAGDNSVLTEPVFGNGSGEPCNTNWSSTQNSRSPCLQAWRWMLDTKIDPNNVVTSYHYAKETNNYDSVLGPNLARPYDMGANLTEVDYGWADALTGTNYTDKAVLTWVGRCKQQTNNTDPLRSGNGTACPNLEPSTDNGQGGDSTAATSFPDVPATNLCYGTWLQAAHHCDGTSFAPTFFSMQMLSSIVTSTLTTTGTATQVMNYTLRHGFVNPTGAVSDFLWLDYIQREGFSGTGSPIILPIINFNGTDMDNIVGSTDLEFRRITSIYNDLGGLTTVSYGLPDACTSTNLPASESNNTMDCYKQAWTPDGSTTAQFGWFKKWVVTEVDDDPQVGETGNDGDSIQTTSYDYSGGKPGWRFPWNPLEQAKDESWTNWRGYSQVVVTEGGSTNLHATAYWIYQGLDGDRTNTSGTTTKSVTVTGSAAGPTLSLTDSAWLADMVYEESFRDSASLSQKYVVNTYGFAEDTANYTGLTDARMVRQTATHTYQRASTSTSDTSTWMNSEQQTYYDSSSQASTTFGLPSSVEEDGNTNTASDDTCTTYGYAYNNNPGSARWIALKDEVRHYTTTTCPNHLTAVEDGYTATLYDGATSPATDVPTHGDATEVDVYTNASTFTSTKTAYDAGGRVISKTDGNGRTTLTAYNPVAGWPTSGVVTTTPIPDIAADDFTGHTGSTTALISTVISDPAFGNTIKSTDANGGVTTDQYDTVGRLIAGWAPKDPTGGNPTAKFTYTTPDGGANSAGTPDVVSGPTVVESQTLQEISGGVQGYVASYAYVDGLGQKREVQTPAPDGSAGRDVVSTRYDSSGFVEGTTAPFYNSSAPGSSMVNPALDIHMPSYTDLIVDWAGRTTESDILAANVKISAEDTHTVYFPDYTKATDPDGNVTTTNLNVFGKPTSVVQNTPDLYPGNSPAHTVTTTYGYDDKQQQITVTDAGSNVSTTAYNWSGQPIVTSTPDAGRTCSYYDPAGNAQYVVRSAPTPCPTDPTTLPSRVSTVYDALERPTSAWLGTPGTGTELTSNVFDTATLGKALPASSTSYNGGSTYTSSVDGYDANGNSLGITITIPSTAGFVATSFDTKTPSYDSSGHSLSTAYPVVGTGTTALPAETVTVGYNNAGTPTTLTSNITGTSQYAVNTVNQIGQLTSRTYGTGILTAARSYTWDPGTSWLTNMAMTVINGSTHTVAQNDIYGYDAAGNVKEVASTTGTAQQQCFTYDSLNRLSSAFTATAATVPTALVAGCGTATANHTGGTAPYDLAYGYDQLGNVASVLDKVAGTTAAYSYTGNGGTTPGGPHAVTQVKHTVTATGVVTGTDTYGYSTSQNGDMTSRTVGGVAATMTYTPQQQMASFAAGGNTTSYVYSASGEMLLRKGPGGSALYLSGEDLNLTGSIVTPTRYYTLGGATVAMRVGGSGTTGTLTWLTADGQDSAQVAVNTTTGTFTRQLYLPFGGQRGSQGPTTGTQNGYLDKAYDPGTSLMQDGARFYDPALGKFLAPDPAIDAANPTDLNAYAYSLDNPETFSDPSGLRPTTGNGNCPSGDPSNCDYNPSYDPYGGDNSHTNGGHGGDHHHHKCGDPGYDGLCSPSKKDGDGDGDLSLAADPPQTVNTTNCFAGLVCLVPQGNNYVCVDNQFVQSGSMCLVDNGEFRNPDINPECINQTPQCRYSVPVGAIGYVYVNTPSRMPSGDHTVRDSLWGAGGFGAAAGTGCAVAPSCTLELGLGIVAIAIGLGAAGGAYLGSHSLTYPKSNPTEVQIIYIGDRSARYMSAQEAVCDEYIHPVVGATPPVGPC